MRYTITQDEDAMATAAAEEIAEVINEKERRGEKAVLGLATGTTPIKVYKKLVEMYDQGKVSFHHVITYNLDEYVYRPYDKLVNGEIVKDDFFTNPNKSYRAFMYHHLFDHIIGGERGIQPENIHILDGTGKTKEARRKECEKYEALLDRDTNGQGADLQLLGIGRNGHVGFCEPKSPIDGVTDEVALAATTIDDNEKKFGFTAPTALSMGLKTIMSAKRILLIANGDSKADALMEVGRTAVLHDDNREIQKNPAMILKYHRNAHAIIDEKAAGKLLMHPSEITMMQR